MAIYDAQGIQLYQCYDAHGVQLSRAYDAAGNIVYTAGGLPVPYGDLTADQTIPLPDLYEPGYGFTCTGLAFDETTQTYLIGDIGRLQSSGTSRSQIVKLADDLTTVTGVITLYDVFTNMTDVQGVCVDTSDNTIWFCNPSGNYIGHVSMAGVNLGTISTSRPTGIAYDPNDDTFWILNYSNQIIHMTKNGTVIETFQFAYNETLDQCFLDHGHGFLYITAGTNYTGRNNVYLFNTATHAQSIACTVDSYSVEGIWIGPDKMIILNDGYYHDAADPRNLINVYNI